MLRFQNVSYNYMHSEKAVLSNVNFQIRPGECIVLAGASGSGKTTLVDLMLGLRKPTNGEIYFNENKLHGFKATDYRSRVSFVGQEPVLFDGSIESNLKLRNASVKSNQIWRILEKLDLLEFVSNLKSGISTIIGERGLSFSGGQKQRFAIAGALLKEAEIIVLDEPTSALDGENEKKLIKLIKQITENGRRSAVVVTHNWSVAKYADRLLKLHLGRLVYDGAVQRQIFDNPNEVK